MKHRNFISMAVIGGVLGLLGSDVSANYVLMNDFEQPSGTSTWAGSVIADPANAVNHVAGGTNFGKALLPASIGEGQVGTIFFRTYLYQNDPVVRGINFNTTDLTLDQIGTSSFSQTMETSAYFGNAANPNQLSSLTPRTWYNVWAVIDNDADTARYYITTGAHPPDAGAPLSLNGVSDFPFRFGTTDPIIAMAIDSTAYLDDIYVDPNGVNLANPTPEPAAMAVLASMALLGLRRRR